MADKLYFSRRPMGYAGQQLDRGQVFRMVGSRNDEKLLRLGYCAALPKKARTSECGKCGGKFFGPSSGSMERDAHVKDRHLRTRELSEEEMEQRESALNARSPLYLDRTKASRKGGRRAGARA